MKTENRGLKFFLITLLISLPFWWGVNVLEKNLKEAFWGQEMTQNPKILIAQINQEIFETNLKNLTPLKVQKEDLGLEAKSALSLLAREDFTDKLLFEKNINQSLAIASLTKLMTAYVVLENYDLSKEIKISKEAVEQEEDFGKLKEGKQFPVEYLLYPLLMESSNDAAFSLANDYDGMTEEKFVELMNIEALKLGLKNSHFFNSTGLDPENPEEPINYSTAEDLAEFIDYLLKTKPLIWEILSTPKYDSYGPELINTNKFLGESAYWQTRIVGGKTGWTPRAKGCLLLVLEAPKGQGWIINVILASKDRFEEMKKLVDWIYQSYKW